MCWQNPWPALTERKSPYVPGLRMSSGAEVRMHQSISNEARWTRYR